MAMQIFFRFMCQYVAIEESWNKSSEWNICYFADEKRLDVLINNAGVMQFQKKRMLTKDAFEMHLGVNYLGELIKSWWNNTILRR